MNITDTHIHLYSEKFSEDREQLITNAMAQGVKRFLLPNIDLASVDPMLELCDNHPGVCFPMIGLHPCDVFADYADHLDKLKVRFDQLKGRLVAVGEIGVDLYWDKTYRIQQEDAFRIQCQWAFDNNLPVVIHSRESTDEIIGLLTELKQAGNCPAGVFHCFSGTLAQANACIELGFMLGIGGVVTYKKSGLDEIVKQIHLEHLLLETDAPYLAPVPYRGKRNDPVYIVHVAEKVAEITGKTTEEIADITSANADRLFRLRTDS